jgi:adenine-specific DNA methylase
LWWARRPIAACRAVLFASLVDDPSAHPDKFPTEEEQQAERQRLHDLIGKIETVGNKQVVRGLVSWDDIKTDETGTSPIIEAAQKEIARCLAWENNHEPPTEPEAVRKYLEKYAPPVYDPYPACGCQMPLVRSFELSKKKGKEAWVEPIIDSTQSPPVIRFEVKTGKGKPIEGTVSRKGAVCLACATPTNLDYVRSEGTAGLMDAKLMAIVAEGDRGRIYLSPNDDHEKIAVSAKPEWKPEADLPHNPRDFKTPNYGMRTFGELFTTRQLVTLTIFSDLVNKAKEKIENGLNKAFERMRKMASDKYPLTVYYAFKQTETETSVTNDGNSTTTSTGWETMLEGLIKAGFSITGTLPMRTELSNRSLAMGTNALACSIALVCRPRLNDAPSATRRQFLKQLQTEFPTDLKNLQQGNIAPVDLAQASIGLGMSVFSRYSKVLEADGSPMRVRTALQIINSYIDEFLNEQEGEFDPDTRWALTWFEQYQFEAGQYGDAETLSKAKNTSIKGLEEAGILVAKNGKVRLLKREELPKTWNPAKDDRTPDWEATQYLIQTLDKQGETGAAKLLAQLGDKGEVCRDLAYRLYVICDRQGWTQQAISYNSLVTSWSEISRLAAMEQQSEKMVQGELAVYQS